MPAPRPARPATPLALPGALPAEPVVSVIIPVYGNLADTLACLDSIALAMPGTPAEIIVVDDASTDGTMDALEHREDIRFLRHDRNLGFLETCNYGATAARGRHLLLLQQRHAGYAGLARPAGRDRRGEPARRHRRIAADSSDGQLQEAGGVIWSDATGWNVGRGHDPAAPRFNFRRAVDYVSGCSLLVRRDLFRALGGFDTRYRPAYYEDTDLAFQVRALGLEVVYQPLSRVFHHEGGSHGNGNASSKHAEVDAPTASASSPMGCCAAAPRPPRGAAARLLRSRAGRPGPDHRCLYADPRPGFRLARHVQPDADPDRLRLPHHLHRRHQLRLLRRLHRGAAAARRRMPACAALHLGRGCAGRARRRL